MKPSHRCQTCGIPGPWGPRALELNWINGGGITARITLNTRLNSVPTSFTHRLTNTEKKRRKNTKQLRNEIYEYCITLLFPHAFKVILRMHYRS